MLDIFIFSKKLGVYILEKYLTMILFYFFIWTKYDKGNNG